MNVQAQTIIGLAIHISQREIAQVFVHYSAHVQRLDIRISPPDQRYGETDDITHIFTTHVYLDDSSAARQMDGIITTLRRLRDTHSIHERESA